MSKFKPCPFCGDPKPHFSRERDSDGFGVFVSVQCGTCRAQSAQKFTSEECPIFLGEVADAWNRRPEEPEVILKQERYACGCVTCVCDDEIRCHGCGATSCGSEQCRLK